MKRLTDGRKVIQPSEVLPPGTPIPTDYPAGTYGSIPRRATSEDTAYSLPGWVKDLWLRDAQTRFEARVADVFNRLKREK